MDLKVLETVDVFLVSRHQRTSPHLGISRSISELSTVLQYLNLKVCIISEGEDFEVRNSTSSLVELDIPKEPRILWSMWQLKLPHPVAAWIKNISLEFIDHAIIIVPVVGLQSYFLSMLTSPNLNKIATLHTPYSKSTPTGMLFFYLQKKTLRSADYIIANSNTICEKYETPASDRVWVIPHYVEAHESRLESSDSPRTGLRYLWIGALTLRKGADRLIRLIILGKRRVPIDVVWTRTRFSMPFELCLRFFNKLNWVNLHNRLSKRELDEIIEESSGLISTSRYESFGMTIVEAASHSKGLIAMYAPGIIETLPETSNGAMYFAKVSQLNKYLEDASVKELSVLGRNANEFYNTHYGLIPISLRWDQILGSL